MDEGAFEWVSPAWHEEIEEKSRPSGLTFETTGTTWGFFLALFACSLGRHLRERPSCGTWLNRTAGALFVLLGMGLATSKWSQGLERHLQAPTASPVSVPQAKHQVPALTFRRSTFNTGRSSI